MGIEWCRAINREVKWRDKVGLFESEGNLWKERTNSSIKYDKLYKTDLTYPDETDHNFKYWTNETRENWNNYISYLLDERLEKMQSLLKNYEQREEEIENEIKSEQKDLEFNANLQKFVNDIRNWTKSAIDLSFINAKEEMSNYKKSLKFLQAEKESADNETDIKNIFDAIKQDNLKKVYDFSSVGIDMSKCNHNGFTPLTYAAYCGNSGILEMLVKNCLTEGIDIMSEDERGYNVLETAAMEHDKLIIEILIKEESSLVDESRPLSEMANLNDFQEWLNENVNEN